MARSREEVNGEIEYHLQSNKTYQRIHYRFSSMSDEDYDRNNKIFTYALFSDKGNFKHFSNIQSLDMDIDLKPGRRELLEELTITIDYLLEGLVFSYRDYFNAQRNS